MERLRTYSVILLAALPFILSLQSKNKHAASAQDATASVITIHVHKSGLLSGFGHNHTVTAPVAGGKIDTRAMAAEIRVASQDMKVVDHDASEKDRAQIQTDMLGPKVLDATRFPEIRFVSSRIEQAATGHYRVTGKLELHGVARELTFETTGGLERYHGQTRLKQTDFGIHPISVAGGSIKVKDEIEVEFDINAAHLTGGSK